MPKYGYGTFWLTIMENMWNMGSVGVLEEDEKSELLQEKLKELELEQDILRPLLGISDGNSLWKWKTLQCNQIDLYEASGYECWPQ